MFALHEFAHTLDLSDGAADGIGDLDAAMVKRWYELMKDELRKCDNTVPCFVPTPARIRVSCLRMRLKHFFQRPEELRSHHPELYEALSSFFNQHL